MKSSKTFILLTLLVLVLGVFTGSAFAQDQSTVRVLFFYSPTCQHCHIVITEVLPPLFDQYGEQLLILEIDVSTQFGSEFFQAVLGQLENPPDRAGVPFMLVADTVLIGSQQIPEELPGLIEAGLAAGGLAWSDMPVIQEFLLAEGYINEAGQDTLLIPQAEEPTPEPTALQATESPQTTPTELAPSPTNPPAQQDNQTESGISLLDPNAPAVESGSAFDRFNRDKIANGIAVVVLLVMIAVFIRIGIQFMQAAEPKPWPGWILPVLLVLGFAIAVYLGLIEVTGDEAICGPVGDCNAVQQSKYAKLFGVIPVAILGMASYIAIGTSWLVSLKTSGKVQFFAKMAMFLIALIGLLFFIYLTFLEPFVIGATCAWCISSAIIMTLINLYATPIALNALAVVDDEDSFEGED